MSWRVGAAVVVAAGVGVGMPAAGLAQRAGAIRPGLVTMVAASDPVFGGVGPLLGWSSSSRIEFVGSALVGRRGSATVGRGELTVRFYPSRPIAGRTNAYALTGIAGVTGSDDGGFVVVAVGVEAGKRARWFAEAGIGGGVRLAVGIRPALSRRRPQAR